MNTQPAPTNEKQFLHQYTPGALLPLLQSFITSIITFLLVFVLMWMVFDVLDPHKPALVIALIVLLISWVSRQKMWVTLAQLERWTGLDLNNDHKIADEPIEEVQPKTSTVYIDLRKISRDGGYSNSKFPLPKGVTEEHLAQIARDMFTMGRTFTETQLSGPGKISLPKFRQLRAVMKTQGLCEKIGTADNADFELTDEGEAWLRSYLPSPAPSEEDA